MNWFHYSWLHTTSLCERCFLSDYDANKKRNIVSYEQQGYQAKNKSEQLLEGQL